MHRNRTWTLDPPEWRINRNRVLDVIGGDGSTLNLDFTTGVLDPRLTFTRTSNATYVNSQGYVKYAVANMQPNTTFDGIDGSTYSTLGWGGFVGTGAIGFTRLSSGVLKCSGATSGSVTNSNRAFLSTIAAIPSGLPVTLKMTILDKNVSSTLDLVNFLSFVSATSSYTQYRVNGVAKDPLFNGVVSGDVITLTVIPTQTTGSFRFGLGCNTNQGLSNYVTVANVMLEQGEEVNATYTYLPNSATTVGNYNTPRFDHDPTTLAPRGLLIEGSATNICTYSGDMTQSGGGHWSVRFALITTSWTGFTAPDGTATAVKIIPDTSSSRHTLESSSTSVVSGTTYTASAFVKADGYSVVSLVIAGGQTRRNFTLSGNGTPESQFGISNTATITPVGSNGWYRVTMTWTANATGGAGLWIGVPQNATTDVVSSWSGNGTSAIQAWGAQLETGSGASSYIPTGASQVTRNADECSMTGTNFSSWFNASAGTLLVSARTATRYVDSAGFDFPAVLTLDSNNHIGPCQWNSVVYGVVRAGGSYRINYAALASPGNNANYKAAIAYADSDYAGVANNGSIQTGSGTTVPSGLNQLVLGASRSGVAGNFFGHISQIKFWPTRLPNAQLQALTTG